MAHVVNMTHEARRASLRARAPMLTFARDYPERIEIVPDLRSSPHQWCMDPRIVFAKESKSAWTRRNA